LQRLGLIRVEYHPYDRKSIIFALRADVVSFGINAWHAGLLVFGGVMFGRVRENESDI
jgi:hypothetical protein